MGKKRRGNNGEGPEIGSSQPFKDLAKQVAAFPELPEIQAEGLDFQALQEQAAVIKERAKEVADWVASALTFLDRVGDLDRVARELVEKQITTAQGGLERLLHEESTPAYRRAAWLAYLKHMLSREFRSPDEAKILFQQLVEAGRLQESPDGMLSFAGTKYTVPEQAAFGDPEVQEIAGMIEGLNEKALQAERAARKQKAHELVGQGDLSIDEFLAGKAGKLAIQVPPEKVSPQQGNGTFWRPGGLLLVESADEKCWPLDAVGGVSFVNAIHDAMDLGVFLIVPTLHHDRRPRIDRETLPDEAKIRKIHLLWHLLKRGIVAHQEQEQILGDRNQLTERANLTPAEFFLEHKPGVCLVEYRGPWQTPEDDESIYNVFFLVERRTKEDDTTTTIIGVVDVPAHLSEFLGEYVGQEFPEEEQFRGIPYPLGAVLKAVYGQVQKSAKIASE